MEKLSEIAWGIWDNKWIEHKFELKSDVTGITRQKVPIYLQNMVSCFKILIEHPSFWHNQTYEPSRIYNENE